MKNIQWLWRLPIIVLFTFCFWVTELGYEGHLQNDFLREKLFPALSRASNTLVDLKFKYRGPQSPKNKIVIIDIDSAAIETLGRWPWHRDAIAFLIEKAFGAGAKVVGLDMIFSESDIRVPEGLVKLLAENNLASSLEKFETDRALEEVIRKFSDRLVLGWTSETTCQPSYDKEQFCPVTDLNALSQYPEDFDKFAIDEFNLGSSFQLSRTPIISFLTPITNIALYHSVAKHTGFLNAILDSDGYIRKSNLISFAKGKPFPSLALELARVGLAEKLKLNLDEEHKVKDLIFLNSGRALPTSPLGELQINFRGPNDSFPHVPALEIMNEKENFSENLNAHIAGKTKSDVFKDAYVLIGLTALGVFDMRQFPFESNAPGVDGHANILDNILSGDALDSNTIGRGSFWILLLMVIGVSIFAVIIQKINAVPGLLLFLMLFLSLWFSDFCILFNKNMNWNTSYLYLELMTVYFLTLAIKYVIEEKNKKFIRGAFAKYVAPAVVDSIIKDHNKLSLGGEKRELSILFSDIRGFTTISEKMDAKLLASFLNDYLGTMTGLVFSHRGTLDKYIGDALMAFWGAPLPYTEHAYDSCKSAIEMQHSLEKSRTRFRDQYGIEVKIGIGINSGIVSVGNMGSEQNFNYTVIGDHVNLASRLEGLTKEYGAGILTTRFTFDSMQASGKGMLPHRVLDQVKVKGKEKAVELIQVLDRDLSLEGLKYFLEGRILYQSQKWDEAIEVFENANRLLALDSEHPDGPCELFIERCRMFKENPPSPAWDGSWKMDTK